MQSKGCDCHGVHVRGINCSFSDKEERQKETVKSSVREMDRHKEKENRKEISLFSVFFCSYYFPKHFLRGQVHGLLIERSINLNPVSSKQEIN